MEQLINRINAIKTELRNPSIDTERKIYLLDLKEQLTAKLSEVYLMETVKNDRRIT